VALQDEGAPDSGEGGGGGGTDLVTTQADSTPIYEGGKLSPGASKTFRSLEAANPKARSILRRALGALDTVGRMTTMLGDKPVARAKQLLTLEREVGTYAYIDGDGKRIDGLTAIRGLDEDVKANDTMYETANPLLIQNMTESQAGKNAFVKLFPHVVSRLRDIAPKTYTKWLGAQMLHWMEKADVTIKGSGGGKGITEAIDIPFRLMRMIRQLPFGIDKDTGQYLGGAVAPEQAATLAYDIMFVQAFLENVRGYAAETPEDLTPPAEDKSVAAIAKANKEADDALQESWRVKRDIACNDILDAEIKNQTKGMNISATIIADIGARARASINKIRKAKPDNHQRQHGYLQAKDFRGYLVYNKGIFQDNAPEAVDKAVALYVKKNGRRTPAATGTAQNTDPAAPNAQTGQKQQQSSGQVIRLTPEQAEALGGVTSTRWYKPPIGGKGTTTEMIRARQMVTRKTIPIPGYPQGLPDGSIVQFP
jgi:hypothetical protein